MGRDRTSSRRRLSYARRVWIENQGHGEYRSAEITIHAIGDKRPNGTYWTDELLDIEFFANKETPEKFLLFRLKIKPERLTDAYKAMQKINAKLAGLSGLTVENDFERYWWACKQVAKELTYSQDDYGFALQGELAA